MYLVTVQLILKMKLIHLFFFKKPFSRTNYIESNIGEDIESKNLFRVKNLKDPISIRDAGSKNYIDNIFKNDTDINGVK